MLKTVLSFFVCGLGQITCGRIRRGLIFFGSFSFSLVMTLYRFFIEDVSIYLALADNREIKVSYFYMALTFLIWFYNVIDTFEPVDEIKIEKGVDYYGKGRVASLNGDYSEAARNFTAAVKVNSKDTDAIFQLGRCYYQMGTITKARSVFDKYLASGDKKWRDEIYELTKQE